MKRFRLDTVLRVRERREEAAAIELAHARGLLRRQEQVVAALRAERRRLHENLSRLESKEMLARDLLLHHEWDRALARRTERERLRLAEREVACEERRVALLERSKEKRIIERLRERQRQMAKLAETRAEQKVLDELGSRLHASGGKEEGP